MTVTTCPLRISDHAITRYRERVDRAASRLEARLALQRLASLGRVRAVPRHWMRRNGVEAQPGVTFIYCVHAAHVGLVVRDGVVLTILTRSLCARRSKHLRVVDRDRRPAAAEDRARWRWDGAVDRGEDAA